MQEHSVTLQHKLDSSRKSAKSLLRSSRAFPSAASNFMLIFYTFSFLEKSLLVCVLTASILAPPHPHTFSFLKLPECCREDLPVMLTVVWSGERHSVPSSLDKLAKLCWILGPRGPQMNKHWLWKTVGETGESTVCVHVWGLLTENSRTHRPATGTGGREQIPVLLPVRCPSVGPCSSAC